jgi:hypothetical protein
LEISVFANSAMMSVPVTAIWAQGNLRNCFDESNKYLRTFILSSSHAEYQNVSALGARTANLGKCKGGLEKQGGAKKGNTNGDPK